MADIESNVKVNIDTSDALAQLKLLQNQISVFQQAMRKAGAANAASAAQLQQNLVNSINASGKFNASIQTIQTSAERFTGALEKNKLTMGEYFRYAGGASKTFGKLFKTEFETINQVARERVKDLQTQYIKLGRDASGAMKAISIRPTTLDMENLGTQTQITAQRQQLFNQLMTQGSTQLLNFGKNTQWAGRQLMVGFTIPLTLMGTAAAKAYTEIEKASIAFRRVYGDINTTSAETEKMAKEVQKLANEFTKYGVSVADTMDMAAKAAAMGKTGAELLQQISQANRLAVLGQVEQNEALETTISLTNAFGTSADELAGKIDFLNAVENQTVTAIEDLTVAIPKAAPVIKQLGGDVEDLAFFLTAMKEGGINASEGANALKSGLASMINPTKQASNFLAGFGVNVRGIVDSNKGDVRGTVIEMAKAFDTLDPLNRARAIEQMFGKFQFSRISTLFQNVIKEGSQAQTVAGLGKQTAEELAVLSERELSKISDSPLFKFEKSLKDIQAKLAPVGEAFLKAVTPIMEFVGKVLDGFNSLGDGTKQFIGMLTLAVAGVGPILLMTFGLIANGVANIMKLFTNIKGFINKTTKPSDILGEQTGYMNSEQIKGAAIAASLDQAHSKLRQTFTSEAAAVNQLTTAYRNAVQAQQAYSGIPGVPVGNPNALPAAGTQMQPRKYANGVSMVPGPRGAGDIVPALLSPGEAVIPAKHAQKYAPVIAGMVAGNLPGFENGTTGAGMRQSTYGPLTQRQTEGLARTGLQLKEISDEVMAGPYGAVPPTDFGTQISPTTGHSFPAFSVGGIYEKPNGTRVFVKPQMDLTSALAEVRGTTIARDAHGLVAPKQEIRVMMDPTDPDGLRKFIVLESALDERIANIPKEFSNQQYFTQLVASLLRGDKDLGIGNLGGDILADVGTAGVFGRASGKRALGSAINSMEEQAIVNLLGVKGGAKRFFAEATSEQISKMAPGEYDAAMKAEIQRVLPKLDATIAGFGAMSPEETAAYASMQERLRAGLGVDWSRYQVMHSAVPPKKFEDGGFAGLTQASHTQRELDKNDPAVRAQIEAIYPGLKDEHLQYMTVLGNLTADLPTWVNQRLIPGKGGIVPPIFQKVWNSINGKFNSSARAAGVPANLNNTLAQIENTIGSTTVKIAGARNVVDPILADGTKEALFSSVSKGGDYAQVANRLIERSNTVGSIRADLGKNADGKLRELLASGIAEFAPNGKDVVFAGTKIKIGRFALASSTSKPVKRAEQEKARASWIASGAVAAELPEELKLRGSSIPPGSFRRSLTGISSYDELLASITSVSDPNVFDEKLFTSAQKFAVGAEGVGGVKGGKKKASVFDIDDTLLDLSSFMAQHKAENDKLPEDQKKKWYKEVAKNPKGIPAGLAALKAAQERGNKILLMTARPDFYEPYTIETLQKLGINMDGIKLIARRDKDYRKPEQMKYDKTSAYMKYYDIEEFYDDMPATRAAISLLGIKTTNPLKLANGVFSVPGPKGAGDIVPAMLSPGEAVIPARQAEQHRGLISSMISGNLPGYRNGTVSVPGYKSGIASVPGFQDGGFVKLEFSESRPLPVIIMRDLTEGKIPPSPGLPEVSPEEQYLSKSDDEKTGPKHRKDTMGEKLMAGLKSSFDRSAFGGLSGKVQGGMYGASAIAASASMIPKDIPVLGKVGEAAQSMVGPIGAATAAMSAIPGPAGLVVGAFTAGFVAYQQVTAHLNKLRDEAEKLGKAMGTGNEAIGKFAEFAKKATGTEVMNKQRTASAGNYFNIVPGKKTFGESYMETDAGKELVKNVDKSISQGGMDNAKNLIVNQLSAAIAAGALTPAQARSIANNLGAQLGDMSFGIEVSGRLTNLLGPNGEDLKKDPLKVRMQIIESGMEQFNTKKELATGENIAKMPTGWTGMDKASNTLASAGAGAIGGAAIGAGLGLIGGPLAPLTVAAGAVLGAAVGGLTGMFVGIVQHQENIAKAAGQMSAAVGNQLELQQQMVDSLEVEYQKRIDSAIAAGDTAEAVRLQNQYLTDQKKLMEVNAEQTNEMYTSLRGMDSGVLASTKDKAIEGIATAYEGQGMDLEVSAAQDKIKNMVGDDAQKAMLGSMVAKKQIGFNQLDTAIEMYGGSEEGAATLEKLLTASPTEANRAFGIAAGLEGQARATYMSNVEANAADPMKMKESNDAMELARQTTGVFYGDKKTTTAILNYAVQNEDKMIQFKKNVDSLKKQKKVDIGVVSKIMGPDVGKVLEKNKALFNKYSKQDKIVYATEIQQLMAMKGDAQMIAAFKAWQTESGNMTATIEDYFSYQADRTVTTQGSDRTGAGAAKKKEAAAPEPSMLDPYVKALREASNWQQKLTVGWNASLKALQAYTKKGIATMAGGAVLMQQYGADANFIQAFLGGTEAEQNKIINKTTGKLTAAGKRLIAITKQIEDAKIGMAYILMSPAERLAKDNELYSAGLEVIGGKEKKINDAYDKRFKALDQIAKIQDKVNAGKQNELDLADALSKGDISAAARIALKTKQEEAKQALSDARENLENQKAEELSNIQVIINGQLMSRADLEQKIADNAEKIAAFKLLEEQRQANIARSALAAAQASATSLANGRALANLPGSNGSGSGGGNNNSTTTTDDMTDRNKKPTQDAGVGKTWSFQNGRWTAMAVAKAQIWQDSVVNGRIVGRYVTDNNALWNTDTDTWESKPVTRGSYKGQKPNSTSPWIWTGSDWKALKDVGEQTPDLARPGKDIGKTVIPYKWDGSKWNRIAGYATGGLVKNYMSDGGTPNPFSRGTDTIPAMLTPGEFVFRKSAVDAIGVDNLTAMNNGSTQIGESVYNYSVTLNVSSTSDSSDIADKVLQQIKRLDSQRIRSSVI